jgi:hypothetical protein
MSHQLLPDWPAGKTGFARRLNVILFTLIASVVLTLVLWLAIATTPSAFCRYGSCVSAHTITLFVLTLLRVPVHFVRAEWLLLVPCLWVLARQARQSIVHGPAESLSIKLVRHVSILSIVLFCSLLATQVFMQYMHARFWSLGDGKGARANLVHTLVMFGSFAIALRLHNRLLRARVDSIPGIAMPPANVVGDVPLRGSARSAEQGFTTSTSPRGQPTATTTHLHPHRGTEPVIQANVYHKQDQIR